MDVSSKRLAKSMLTKEEGHAFIENVLQIEKANARFQSDRLGLLNDVIAKIHSVLPMQNITLLEMPHEQRGLPPLENVKEACLHRIGGLCYTLNVFLFYLLKAVGYDTFLNGSQLTNPSDHIIVLVKSVLHTDDLYLAEVACGYPTFEAVNLNFATETEVFRNVFDEYKFIKSGQTITRLHKFYKGEAPTPSQEFKPFYEFNVNPIREIHEFDSCMERVYRDPSLTHFLHLSYRAKRFSKDSFVIIVNYKLLIGSGDGKMKTTILENDAELLEATRKYFPEIEEMSARKAIVNWRKVYKQ